MIRNVVFDWSGTLADDLPAVWQATNLVFRRAGVPELALATFRSEFALPFHDFYRRHVPQVPLPELEAWFHEFFPTVAGEVRELPHARRFLEYCREQGWRTFLLSAVHPVHFAVQASATGFGEFLHHVYPGVWDKRAKILELVAVHALRPDETLLVGDMQHDIETARHGGVHSCAVLTGYNRLDQLRAADPELIVEHLGELEQRLAAGWPGSPREVEVGSASAATGLPVVTVGGLIVNSRDEVLMIRTRKWSDLWGIPGGKIKLGEGSEEALRREILEETSLEVDDVRFVLVQDCIDSKEFYRPAHFILLNYICRCRGSSEVRLNEEAQRYRWVSMDEARGMALNHPTRVLLDTVSAGHGANGQVIEPSARG